MNPGELLRIASYNNETDVLMRESMSAGYHDDKNLPSKRKASMLVHSLYSNHVKTPLYE